MEIKGVIQKVQYFNPVNGYTVALFELAPNEYKITKSRNHLIGNRFAVVGIFDRKVIEGEEYRLEGEFVSNPNYGMQFKFERFMREELSNEAGIINYLSSDIFPGIGIKTAKTIVEKLGINAIDSIISHPEVLESIGISKKNREVIYQVLKDNQINQQIILFFMNYGITIEMCHKIVATLGNNAIEIVKESPYILMEKISHFGFKKNDAFALKMGIKKDATVRLKAVIIYVLKDAIYNSGNSYLERHQLLKAVRKYLEEDLDSKRFNEILERLINENLIFCSTEGYIFDASLYRAEVELSKSIVKKLKNERELIPRYDELKINKVFDEIASNNALSFDRYQASAIKAAFSEPIVIITGGPGTGKTTIIKTIIEMYLKLHGDGSTILESIALLAPTGRAAKRLKEVTRVSAQTIHKFLGYMGENYFTYSRDNPTDQRLIIVDEASMMDLPLAHRLVTSMCDEARLIIVGDVDQLPSVGPGQVLKDLIDTKEIKTIRLHKIHRQAEDSQIIKLAHQLNEGFLPENILETFDDRAFLSAEQNEIMPALKAVIQKAQNSGHDIKKDIQVLAPMYRGEIGINEINHQLQALINPLSKDTQEIKYNGQNFRLDDKVIQLVNRADKNIMNGDIGIINNFLYQNGVITGITVMYDVGGVDYKKEELEDLKLAYAISVHKAQGSEFEVVILPMTNQYYFMLKRKLIYTAITRAKKILILIGDVQALKFGVNRIEEKRLTILNQKIKAHIQNIPQIDDACSAFDTLGEKEFGNFNPYDFE